MKNYSDLEKSDAEKVNNAVRAISRNDLSVARSLLQEVILNTPEEYIYSYSDESNDYIKFWSYEEFYQYITGLQRRHIKNVVWVISVYPRAYYYLAYIDVHEGNYKSAIANLENCLKLEPDQPECYCEMAIAYSGMGQHKCALSLYNKALQVRPYMTAATRARALRGIGVELIDVRELDLAEKYLKESLKYDPGSELAYNELEYIKILRAEGGTRSVEATQVTTNKKKDV